ncbi:hypothetical protein C8Q77DRAFT_1077353 [Trametes polyzona]|nr:hypothetical protein C8Q77DRAFT_1077353 [Trametes polyzona]
MSSIAMISRRHPRRKLPRLPIEVWERVLRHVAFHVEVILGHDRRQFTHGPCVLRAASLCQCALVCRAWRVCAQILLWEYPCFRRRVKSLPILQHAALQEATVHYSQIVSLHLGVWDQYYPDWNDLFFRVRLPNLRILFVANARKESNLNAHPAKLVRMRLPFFATITQLRLHRCKYYTFRGLLDLIWACPKLEMLSMSGCWDFQANVCTPRTLALLDSACKNMNGCQKLKKLILDLHDVRLFYPVPFLHHTELSHVDSTSCVRQATCSTEAYLALRSPTWISPIGTLSLHVSKPPRDSHWMKF